LLHSGRRQYSRQFRAIQRPDCPKARIDQRLGEFIEITRGTRPTREHDNHGATPGFVLRNIVIARACEPLFANGRAGATPSDGSRDEYAHHGEHNGANRRTAEKRGF
jgi:hypothetical protein